MDEWKDYQWFREQQRDAARWARQEMEARLFRAARGQPEDGKAPERGKAGASE